MDNTLKFPNGSELTFFSNDDDSEAYKGHGLFLYGGGYMRGKTNKVKMIEDAMTEAGYKVKRYSLKNSKRMEQLKSKNSEMLSNALFSECGKYRYWLSRKWDTGKGRCMFIMLNPSTANGTEDDNTIRRCISIAKALGYNELIAMNLYPFIATYPKDLAHHYALKIESGWSKTMHADIENLKLIREHAGSSDIIICAWGNIALKIPYDSKKNVYKLLVQAGLKDKIHCLEINKTGEPKHPLYVKRDVQPVRFEYKSRFQVIILLLKHF